MTWTTELKSKFIAAIDALGEDVARPKGIFDKMNVPGLTYRHVASYYQKYKLQLQKVKERNSIEDHYGPGRSSLPSTGAADLCETASFYSNYLTEIESKLFEDDEKNAADLGQTTSFSEYWAEIQSILLFQDNENAADADDDDLGWAEIESMLFEDDEIENDDLGWEEIESMLFEDDEIEKEDDADDLGWEEIESLLFEDDEIAAADEI